MSIGLVSAPPNPRALLASNTRNASRASNRIRESRRNSTVGPTQVSCAGEPLIWRRYTLTYTPSLDRLLPSPTHLHLKVKNTSAIPLRAAYLHGPYTLYTACYPSTFNPNHKDDSPWHHGSPDFEPKLKAGGSWFSHLTVPENIRETAGKANVKRTTDGGMPSCTWIIEISSQVIFSTSATVHFEVLIGSDGRSIDLGFLGLTGEGIATPGQLQDHQQGKRRENKHNAAQPKGVFSKAVVLEVDDTESLWNKPALPEWNDTGEGRGWKNEAQAQKKDGSSDGLSKGDHHSRHGTAANECRKKKRKRVHLVVITHGLHSNLGVDMLYLKESIDAAAKQSHQNASHKEAKPKSTDSPGDPCDHMENYLKDTRSGESQSTAPLSGGRDDFHVGPDVDLDSNEEVIVRGFSGNCVRTERGVQYLGKRLAKYVLEVTYPDHPFLPVQKSAKKKLSRAFSGQEPTSDAGLQGHTHDKIYHESRGIHNRAFKITSISFIAHSLGGLTQTYAIAYIHKHSPRFFKEIKPVNFVTMASPFLGLSNENPLYVRFALDFGLVGKTGQDLGLAWRAPAMVRSGWGAIIGGIGSEGQRALRHPDPSSKPLLRILPTGPAHEVLKLFRNRTVYSNVVNDGIVPLRTSCLLFLDWSGLDRVEKARRENGIVGTMAGWGWAELTGANSSSHGHMHDEEVQSQARRSSVKGSSLNKKPEREAVPQPEESEVEDQLGAIGTETYRGDQFLVSHQPENSQDEEHHAVKLKGSSPANPLGALLSFLRPASPKSRQPPSLKQTKIYRRSQTRHPETGDGDSISSGSTFGRDSSLPPSRPRAARGDSILEDPDNNYAPPKTSFFEAAGDLLNPPLPSKEFIINPASRPRTIFHDRVYHPEDIPLPSIKKRKPLSRTASGNGKGTPARADTDYTNTKEHSTKSGMKVEEKIARAYHRDMSWRKVLVRLEPDAHNNICVRRMFANAYGWPVVKHLVDTHFSESFAATTADENEPNQERARPMSEGVGEHGEEVDTTASPFDIRRTNSEMREAKDGLADLALMQESNMSSSTGRPRATREDSAQWDDALFDLTDDDSDIVYYGNYQRHNGSDDYDGRSCNGTADTGIAAFLSSSPANASDSLTPEKPPRRVRSLN